MSVYQIMVKCKQTGELKVKKRRYPLSESGHYFLTLLMSVKKRSHDRQCVKKGCFSSPFHVVSQCQTFVVASLFLELLHLACEEKHVSIYKGQNINHQEEQVSIHDPLLILFHVLF